MWCGGVICLYLSPSGRLSTVITLYYDGGFKSITFGWDVDSEVGLRRLEVHPYRNI